MPPSSCEHRLDRFLLMLNGASVDTREMTLYAGVFARMAREDFFFPLSLFDVGIY